MLHLLSVIWATLGDNAILLRRQTQTRMAPEACRHGLF
jgi:hypothetical protein